MTSPPGSEARAHSTAASCRCVCASRVVCVSELCDFPEIPRGSFIRPVNNLFLSLPPSLRLFLLLFLISFSPSPPLLLSLLFRQCNGLSLLTACFPSRLRGSEILAFVPLQLEGTECPAPSQEEGSAFANCPWSNCSLVISGGFEVEIQYF